MFFFRQVARGQVAPSLVYDLGVDLRLADHVLLRRSAVADSGMGTVFASCVDVP